MSVRATRVETVGLVTTCFLDIRAHVWQDGPASRVLTVSQHILRKFSVQTTVPGTSFVKCTFTFLTFH